MLFYLCDYCETKYNAHINLRNVKYGAKGSEHELESEDDPCFACEDAAETAKKEALERRKQNGKTI